MLDSDLSPNHQHRTRVVSKKEAKRQKILIPFLLITMVSSAILAAVIFFEMDRRSLDVEGAVRLAKAKWALFQDPNMVSITHPEGEANPGAIAMADAFPAHLNSLPTVKIHSNNAVVSGLKKVLRQGGDDPAFIPVKFSEEILIAVRQLQKERTHKATYRRLAAIDKTIQPLLAERHLPPMLRAICWIESQGSKGFEDVQSERLGLWALTPEMARKHGIDLSQRPDPRSDPIMATLAARSYLMELFYQAGGKSWTLAALAYTSGPDVLKTIRARQDVWLEDELTLWHWLRQDYIPTQERRYMVKVLAAAVLFEEAEAFDMRTATER